MSDVTRILSAIQLGDPSAAEDLLPLVYNELRKLAASHLAHEGKAQTLQPTALVHEAYLRLVGISGKEIEWNSRGHFFGAAAMAMRRILVENVRRKQRIKYGGDLDRVELGDCDVPIQPPAEDILALDEALTRLALEDPESARLVEMHFFAGQSLEDVAVVLGISRATAYRQWSHARAWLRLAIAGQDDSAFE